MGHYENRCKQLEKAISEIKSIADEKIRTLSRTYAGYVDIYAICFHALKDKNESQTQVDIRG